MRAGRLRVVAAAWTVRKEVREAMLDLYAGRRIGALLQAESVLHEEGLKMFQLQVEAGESAAYELTQSRLALNHARLAQHHAEKISATALARLAAAVGVPSVALEVVTLDFSPFDTLPRDPGGEARRQALVNRADLLAALAAYRAARAKVDTASGLSGEAARAAEMTSRMVERRARPDRTHAPPHRPPPLSQVFLTGSWARVAYFSVAFPRRRQERMPRWRL